MLSQNKFSAPLLKKLRAADPFDFVMLEKLIEKSLIGLSINLTSRITRQHLNDVLGLSFEDAEQFSSQLVEKLRRHTMNSLEQIKKSR